MIIFEQSGHFTCFEEPKRFNELMIQMLEEELN
ncbi:pimeloyl-ACP methyl ester carboxylesterase [Paenibacillus sp. PvR052]|nr:pimeloyl-ACP methyl ester carboxylesterase [Paenibacillus sp. PvP091]MBP1170314.1 pimeloyl-ACP methyl ester carboxylesterase [Paenibacillus sp. PvR098]MBP2441342.1 pimeloyl-ACP methyl ester carboxylesterase [Paenibacillus sp. PvP052]